MAKPGWGGADAQGRQPGRRPEFRVIDAASGERILCPGRCLFAPAGSGQEVIERYTSPPPQSVLGAAAPGRLTLTGAG